MPPPPPAGPTLPTQLAFVVQFAAEAAAEQGRCVGRVEHVVSGQAQRFHTGTELLAFLARVLQQQRPAGEGHGGPAGAFAQKHTVLHNILSDSRLHGQKTASEITDFLAQGLF